MTSPTELYLPPTLSYPIKVVSLDSKPLVSITRGTRLLSYSFIHIPATPGAQPETRFGTWDSAVEGTIDNWKIKPGDVLSQRKAREHPVVSVTEPCKHGVQIGGLCGLCGKDMTDYDYTGFSDASRASIQMTHSAFGPTVSFEEAQRIERETADHLLKSRKLSLIVDLDQTIVHATVDPTVGEWISEGEAWEARQAKKASSKDTSDSDDTVSDSDDDCNPNWEALKDVKKFKLGPESFGPSYSRSLQKEKSDHKIVENEGCMYYIKPRPGWQDFLRQNASKYEMHVYTMGTRAYAEEVCAAIDPDGKIFGGRLLSRDESGSLTQKSLQRLFPCDTSMVVIIDDRADVWEWSPNLIKVIPYDFFVGIGDINSTFLPKLEPLTSAVPPVPSGKRVLPPVSPTTSAETSVTTPSTAEESDRAELATKAMLTQNSLALEAQLEERPLAKKQEELQVASEAKGRESSAKPASENRNTPEHQSPKDKGESPSIPLKAEKVVRKALLKNDDAELERVSKLLDEVHRRFFAAYDSRLPEDNKKRRRNTNKHERLAVPFDVTSIIPRIRSDTLKGVHILFSSVIPLDTRAEATEIWRMAHMFGAKCSTELTHEITHVVAAKRGTVKVDTARKRGGIKIVWLSWFTDCLAQWRHLDETPYLLDDPPVAGPSSSPFSNPTIISSDPDPDTDDWDQDQIEGKEPSSLELNEIDWNDINDEVDAAMNESDDEDDTRSERTGIRSGNVSEDDWTDETNSVISSVNATPRSKRKRLRSLTPSEVGLNGGSEHILRSPLAKRKKLAADRTGYSRLKEAISADDLTEGSLQDEPENILVVAGSTPKNDEMDDEEGDDEEEEEDDDDFLARELEEEWG